MASKDKKTESNDEKKLSVSKSREGGGSTSIKCPMLNSTNYTVWAIKMKILLKVYKGWEVVEKGNLDEEKNDMAMALIFQSIPETLILQIGNLDTAKEVWDAIKTRHLGAERVKGAKLQTLMAEFERLKMKETETIDDFVGKLSSISSKAAELGEEIDDPKMVKKFLQSLPRKKFIHIVASLEQVLDLDNTSFEDIIGRLKAYEERVADEEEEHGGKQDQLMYTRMENQYEQFQSYNEGRLNGTKNLSKIQCFRCDKFGHYASNCPDRLLKLQVTQVNDQDDTQKADSLLMNEVIYLHEKNVKHKDSIERQRERDEWHRPKQSHDESSSKRGRQEGREDLFAREHQIGSDKRKSRQGRSSTRGDHPVDASDRQNGHEKKHKESTRQNRESEGGNPISLVSGKKHQDSSTHNNETIVCQVSLDEDSSTGNGVEERAENGGDLASQAKIVHNDTKCFHGSPDACKSRKEELKEVGPEKLKEALAALGLKTGGNIQQHTERLLRTKDTSPEKLDKKHFAKGSHGPRQNGSTGVSQEISNLKQVALTEVKMKKPCDLLSKTIEQTKENVVKKQALTYEEMELEHRALEASTSLTKIQRVADERTTKAADLEQKVAFLEVECASLNQELQDMEPRARCGQKKAPEEANQMVHAWQMEVERAWHGQRDAESKLSSLEAEVQKMRVEMAAMKRDVEHYSRQEHMELKKRYREQTQLETMAGEKAAAEFQLEKEIKRLKKAQVEVERSRVSCRTSSSLEKAISLCDIVKVHDYFGNFSPAHLATMVEVNLATDSCHEEVVAVVSREDDVLVKIDNEAHGPESSNSDGGVEDMSHDVILTTNKELANISSLVFKKLLPKELNGIVVSEVSNALRGQSNSSIRIKFAVRKQHLRFEKETESCILDYLGTVKAQKDSEKEHEFSPILFRTSLSDLQSQQVFLKDTDERACAYIAGPAPNRWGLTVDGKDLLESVTDISNTGETLLHSEEGNNVQKDPQRKLRGHPLFFGITTGLLAEVINSRLFTTVWDSLGLTYDVSFELNLFDRVKGWHVIFVTSTPSKVYKAVDACKNVLRGLHSNKIVPRELERAKRTLLMRHEAEIKSNAYWLGLLAHLQAFSVPRKDISCVKELTSLYEAASIEDIYLAYEQLKVDEDSLYSCIEIAGVNSLKMLVLILDEKKQRSRFVSSNELVENPCAIEKERALIKFKEMREHIRIQDVLEVDFKLKGENVDINLKSR